MKKIFPLITLFAAFNCALAQQQEVLTPPSINPALYYSTRAYQHNTSAALRSLTTGGDYVINSDTLTLPFIDDFSSNLEPAYNWYQTHVTNTYYNVIGDCLLTQGLSATQAVFSTEATWQYYLDTTYQLVDSFAKQPIVFTKFSNSGSSYDCLSGTPETILLWPLAYAYNFDSSGLPLDSELVYDGVSFDTILYTPVIYFADGEPGTLWFDNYAYINNTFPINPPTIGVATLDGNNQFGQPYDNVTNAGGQADYLTSKPIDLSADSVTDSLYLSFFYEGGGLGDWPGVGDSLIVEFRDVSGNWNIVWSDTGFSTAGDVPDTFQQVLIVVPQLAEPLTYFYNTFQFRFRNVVSVYGSNNLWHIDYVKFDRNRTAADTVIHDMGFTYPFPTILSNYTQLPFHQIYDSISFVDSISLQVRNLDPDAYTGPPATDFVTEAYELYPVDTVVQAPLPLTFNAVPYNYIQIQPASQYKASVDTNADSMVITSEAYINNTNSSIAQHDTLHHTQTFASVMAYDDGSAETAYGLTGLDLKKFALEFDLNRPDTLYGFQYMFTQIQENVSGLVFNFELWDSLQLGSFTYVDSPIVTMINQLPYYVDTVNGFSTYMLDTPILISNKVYAGWAQTDERSLQVGFDRNSPLGRNHMFVYLNGEWDSSTLTDTGSVMIRLLFSRNWTSSQAVPSAITNQLQNKNGLLIFPNPTSGEVFLQGSHNGATYAVEIDNLMGEEVQYDPAVTQKLNISNLASGVYLISARDTQTGQMYRQKIVKTSN